MAEQRIGGRGFTLIELLLVMVILVVLASIVSVQVSKYRSTADISAAKASISNFETALNLFQVTCGRYPSNDEGLKVLVSNPGIDGWTGPYVKLVTPDPWGNPYVYRAPGEYFPDSFDLYSIGADKSEGSEDDIANWQG